MDRQLVSDWKSEVQRRRAILLNYLLLAGTGVGFIAMVGIYVGGLAVAGANPLERRDMWPFAAGWFVVLIAWLWRGLGYRVRAGILLFLTYLMGFYLFSESGLGGSGRIWLVLLPALAFVLLGQWPGFAAGGISILTYAFFAVAFGQGVFTLRAIDLVSPTFWLSEAWDFLLGVVGMALILWSFNRGWVNALTQASLANQQLQAQTEALEETTRLLRATDAIAHACSSILDPKALVAEVVNHIQKEFSSMGVYYVGLFLLDETGKDGGEQFAALKAATGSLGRRLLDQGHTVALDGTSAVGRCIVQQRSIVATGESAGGLPDGSLLEGARSGAVLPLRSRGRVLGALSVQSAQAGVFGESVVDVLEAMADQVAVALDNARLFAQTGSALREVQAAQRRYLGQAWKEFLTIRPVTHVDYVQPGMEVGSDGDGLLQDARLAAMLHERSVATDSASSADSSGRLVSPQTVLAIPLKLRGQVIGTLSLHETRRRRPWTVQEIALAEMVAEQVALTIENLRLMEEAQRRATREQLVGEAAGRMRETLDVDTVLQTAAREIGEALRLHDVAIQLGVDDDRTAE